MTVIKLRRKQNAYFYSSWLVILIGLTVFWYFMNHEVPDKNKEYIIALVGGFAGITLLAGYKVIGKDEAMQKIEELEAELAEWKTKHSACENTLNEMRAEMHKEIQDLRKFVLNKKNH